MLPHEMYMTYTVQSMTEARVAALYMKMCAPVFIKV